MTNEAAPDSPTPARLSASDLADLIDRFVRDGGEYFAWANIGRMSVPAMPDLTKHDADPRKDAFGQFVKAALDSPGGRESDALARGFEAQGNQNEHRARLLKNGPLLATALEGRGADTTGLLRFLSAIDRGGGAETAGPLWPPLKVDLRRVAIQLRHDNESGKAASSRRVWDLRPLSRGTWGNLEQPDDGTSAGQTMKVRRAVGMLNGTHQSVPLLPGQAKPSMGMGLQSRRYYIPTDADIALVKRLFPELTDPSNPPWPQIEARLIVAGEGKKQLAEMNAPTLLLLLAEVSVAGGANATEHNAPAAIIESEPPTATEKPIPPRIRTVGEDYQKAVKVLKADNPDPSDRDVHQALAEAYKTEGKADDLPTFKTWQRYLRKYREATHRQKNTPIAGRTQNADGFVRYDEIDPKELPESVRPSGVDRSGREAGG